MTPLRLLAIIEAYSITGPAKNLLEFAQRALAQNVSTTIVTFTRERPENPFTQAVLEAAGSYKGITLETIQERGPFDPEAIRSLRRLAARVRPDVIQTHAVKSHFLAQSNFPRHVFDSSFADPKGVFNWNIKNRLSSIKVPTVVYAGEEDQATPVAANQFLADNIPGAKLHVIKDVGHFFQLEKPLEFNAALKEFVSTLR